MSANLAKKFQTVLTFDKTRDPQKLLSVLPHLEQLLMSVLVDHGPFEPMNGYRTETSLGFSAERAHVTLQVYTSPMGVEGFESILSNPLNLTHKSDLCKALQEHGHAILVEVAAGSFAGMDIIVQKINELQMADSFNGLVRSVANQDVLEARLAIAQIITSTLAQALNPSAIHWGQSQQVFSSETFIELATGDFNLMLYTGPYFFGYEQLANGDVKLGVRALGSQDLIEKMVIFEPDVQDAAESYKQILMFITRCRSMGRLLDENETFSSDAPNAPRIRVEHKHDIPQLPEGYIALSVDSRTAAERGPVFMRRADEADIEAAMAGDLNMMSGQQRRARGKGFISRILGR